MPVPHTGRCSGRKKQTGGPGFEPSWEPRPLSVHPRVPGTGLCPPPFRRVQEGNRGRPQAPGRQERLLHRSCSSGWAGGTQDPGSTVVLQVVWGSPAYSLCLSFTIFRVRGSSWESHSLEGTRVAKVGFVVGAGTLVCPLPRTQLAQFGEGCPIRTGDTAGLEEIGRCCSNRDAEHRT